ncbi:hypothetical protein AAMO2058_001129300 [Amorphochlora amoebiformis]
MYIILVRVCKRERVSFFLWVRYVMEPPTLTVESQSKSSIVWLLHPEIGADNACLCVRFRWQLLLTLILTQINSYAHAASTN